MWLWAFARRPPTEDARAPRGAAHATRLELVEPGEAGPWSTGTWAAPAAASRAAAWARAAASCPGASWPRAARCRRRPTATRACATSRRRRPARARRSPCATTTYSRPPWTCSVSTPQTPAQRPWARGFDPQSKQIFVKYECLFSNLCVCLCLW